jgi:hypothetical protein
MKNPENTSCSGNRRSCKSELFQKVEVLFEPKTQIKQRKLNLSASRLC